MRYAIITNPVAGKMTVDQKVEALGKPADILNAKICGLEAATSEEFAECAQQIAEECDALVVAGGDGTLSDIINAIDTSQKTIAYLPLGTGNAMGHALGYRGSLAEIAVRIREGKTQDYDLILCDDKRRAFMASMGIEGAIIRLKDRFAAEGKKGIGSYLRAILRACLRDYERANAQVALDGAKYQVEDLLSLMVMKQPYYGYGMRMVPKARFDDCRLHCLWMDCGLFKAAMAAGEAFVVGNRIGQYHICRQMRVALDQPLRLQIDGNVAWTRNEFSFRIIPKSLKIKC